ncbi:ADP-ribosylglycohydrolase family protein [Paenibacillus chungangensis]|uniref:ADP-ribosylglycohydrolase family protein n=1 Tax=Paenibacillus chungangensis TaxID=696535 RepID=A0ABW3HVW4_9BACL
MAGRFTQEQLYEKVYGGWLGKNIGGTLGVPVEGRKELLELTDYPVLPDEPLENDDLDMQLVWLHALEQYGPRLTARELGQEWADHIFFPFDEYGYALANLRRGLHAPVSGSFNNPFKDCMGSPIRSEIWAMVAPGNPDVAAYYAYQDAIVDHAGGEGVYGEMFFAAIQSEAFVTGDRDHLIQKGLSYMPEDCRTARAVQDLLSWHEEGRSWKEARELILSHHGHPNFTDAPQNIAFTLLGWLYGEDFGDAILKAVNCGYDTDCTGATLGAILGIIAGRTGLPERWVKPVGDRVVVSPPVNGFRAPRDLDELTERTLRAGMEVEAYWQSREVPRLSHPDAALTAVSFSIPEGSAEAWGIQATIDYGAAGPAIDAGEAKPLVLTLRNGSETAVRGTVQLEVPEGWMTEPARAFHLEPGATMEWTTVVNADDKIQSVYSLQLHIDRQHDRSVWRRETVPFTLIAAGSWLAGPEGREPVRIAAPGNALHEAVGLNIQEPGRYLFHTQLIVPEEREMKLIVETEAAVSVTVDGERVLQGDRHSECIPAFHRSSDSRTVILRLAAGAHPLEIALEKDERPLQLHVIATAPESADEPGSFYYYTDVLFHI